MFHPPTRRRKDLLRSIRLSAAVAIVLWKPCLLIGQPALVVPDATVGSRLETPATVTLREAASDKGVEITLRSSDPARLLLSAAQDLAGTPSLMLQVRPGRRESPEFWLQGLASAGTVSVTATAPLLGNGAGTVTLTPSAIIIAGPLRGSQFVTTSGAQPSVIRLFSVRLDSSLQFAEDQAVAGGSSVRVQVISSNPSAGIISDSPLEITGGTNVAATQFHPAGEGETTISAVAPPGFSASSKLTTINASVRKPGLAVSEQMYIGQNLQIGGVVSLGEAAPAGGLNVNLVSDDPSKLLLSTSATEIGSRETTLQIPAEGALARYYLQALGKSGTVTYTATARGYRSRTGTISLAPSGFVITPASQGPPDETELVRKDGSDGTYQVTVDLSKAAPSVLVVWTVQLDPVTHRSADVTVQPLRAGVSLSLSLANSSPEVGKINPSVNIPGGSDHGTAEFTPVSVGSTKVSVRTPKDFTPSANSTSVLVTVRN